jgi:hypothetical protein
MPDFTATFTKDAENFTAVQMVWTETMECTHRDLVTLFEAEAKLGTDFMSRLSERGENYSRGGIGLSGVDVRSG